MKYKVTCMARPGEIPAWPIFTATRSSKVEARQLYNEYKVKRFVQGIILKNLSTGEILQAEITGNVITGKRAQRLVLK